MSMFQKRDWHALKDDIAACAREFARLYENRPFDNSNGLHAMGAFNLFYLMRSIDPTFVVESGIWRGFSTWIIGQAVPQARVMCLDPVLAFDSYLDQSKYLPVYRLPGAEYSHEDFSAHDYPIRDAETSVVFFDDHHNKLRRLRTAKLRNFRHIIFDDNMPYPYTHLSLEQIIAEGGRENELMETIDTYDIMPPLWDIHRNGIDIPGLNIEGIDGLKELFNVPTSYTWMTYVRLRR